MRTIANREASDMYSLEQIRDFLLEDELAVHGVSGAVYTQNKALIEMLRARAGQAGPGLQALSLVGSRVQGDSDLPADVDLIAVRSSANVNLGIGRVIAAPAIGKLEVDMGGAAALAGAPDFIPSDPNAFTHAVTVRPRAATVLFHEGIHDTPARRIGGLAALLVIGSDRPGRSKQSWQLVREQYNQTFLGKQSRICQKLSARLEIPIQEVEEVITKDVMQARYEQFGLPADLSSYQVQEEAWLEVAGDQLQDSPQYALYQAVRKVLRP